MVGRRQALAGAALAMLVAACAPDRPREYELRGVVVAVDPAHQEITIKHDDIPRFMPGMTMPFKVRDARLLDGRIPGDLVRATLVVEESDAHLRTLQRTGSAPVPDAPPRATVDLLDAGALVPDTIFIDERGDARHLSDWRGQALAVTFIYTRCPLPNFCPLMDQHFKAAQAAVLKDETLRGRVRLLSVSFDPAYDRPAVLASHARRLAADPGVWSFLTGEREAIDRFASRFGVSIVREGANPTDVIHNLGTAVIDPQGRVSVIRRGNEWTPQELVADLRKAVERPTGR
jgi:protein SCO1